MNLLKSIATATLAAACAVSASAQVRITEVAPWGSGNSTLAADWFEVTNFGSGTVNISGWKMDDNSNAFANSVALVGVTAIAPGESVIFVESATDKSAQFKTLWFGAAAPAGLQIGRYSGTGVGLGTGGDAVNLFNASGVLQASVSFGASPSGPSFPTFDNAVGANNLTLSALSIIGTNGAFVAANGVNEIGSPAAVPEPETYAMLLAGLALIGGIARRRKAA